MIKPHCALSVRGKNVLSSSKSYLLTVPEQGFPTGKGIKIPETTRHKNPMETRTTACLSLPTSSMSENLPKLEFPTELKTPRICTGFPSQGTSTVLVSPRFRCRSRDETAATTYSFQGQPDFSYVQKKTKAHDFHGPSITLLC